MFWLLEQTKPELHYKSVFGTIVDTNENWILKNALKVNKYKYYKYLHIYSN